MKVYAILILLILSNLVSNAQEADILNRHLQSSIDLAVTRGMPMPLEIEPREFEHDDEFGDIFIKVFVGELYDDEAEEELLEFLSEHNMGIYEWDKLAADISVEGSSGYYEIQKTKDWSGGSLIIKEEIRGIEALKESVEQYAIGKFFKELTVKGSKNIFSFRLIHAEYDVESNKVTLTDSASHSYMFQVVPHEEHAVLEVTNHSAYPISIEIFEINTVGEVSIILPNKGCSLTPNELTIAPLSTVRYKNCILSFSPPYETLTLKAVAKLKKADEPENDVKTFSYVSDFEYEIVAEKREAFEDIVLRHRAMNTNLIRDRGAMNFGLYITPSSKQGMYKMNLSKFQNKKHTEIDVLEFIHSYNKNVGLCIYTYIDDKLNVVFYTKEGKVYDEFFPVTEESLIGDISTVNNYFAGRSLHRSPALRGSTPTETSTRLVQAEKHLQEIRELLLPPVEMMEGIEHLIVVPTLNIATLPFYTLELSKGQYLVDKMSYSIAPSLIELLFRLDSNNPYQRKESVAVQYDFQQALLIANPTFSTDGEWNFPSLPGTEEEVDSIVSLIGNKKYKLLKGDNATQKEILSLMEYWEPPDLLYFATHGIADPEDPLDNSFLALAEDDGDAYLTARTIQHLEIYANLVVLSACQTGLGQTHEGGVIGLARAFQLAGANNVLSSLWNIDDKETVIIMTDFFRNIQIGGELMPHEALRQAILKYKNEQNKDPYYWSAFMIFGVPY